MDKNHFISILTRYPGTSLTEAEEILSLKSAYPYSQLLHALSARVTKDHGMLNQQAELQIAAVHAADRSVLREIITYAPSQNVVGEQPTFVEDKKSVFEQIPVPQAGTNEKETVTSGTTKPELEKAPVYTIDSEDVAAEVMRDLKKLSKLKHNFEMLLIDSKDVKITPLEEDKEMGAADQKKVIIPEVAGEPKDIKSKKARIVEVARALQASTMSDEKGSVKQPFAKKKKDVQDEFIEQIQNTKREIAPEGKKQKEQIEVINKFIETQPSISNPKDRTVPPAGDLNPIKSGEFEDNVISETLVEILIKQGKKEKAIEVLKKLIWKYPQKKTYFASQIEELKK